jgi:hypothetical protein
MYFPVSTTEVDKTPKNLSNRDEKATPLCKIFLTFFFECVYVYVYITSSLYISKINLYLYRKELVMKYSDMKPSQLGYRVQDGRLINDAPDLISGISKAALMRKQMKSRTLTQDIADGIELAEQRKAIRNIIKDI